MVCALMHIITVGLDLYLISPFYQREYIVKYLLGLGHYHKWH